MIGGSQERFIYHLGRRVPLSMQGAEETSAAERIAYRIVRHGRFWEVVDPKGALVCLTAYKKGATEVVRRLTEG